MSILKPKLVLPLILFFMILFLFHCGDDEDPIELAPAEPVTLTMITFDQSGLWADAEQQAIVQYQEEKPHITVDRGTYDQWPQQYLSQETPPDIMTMGLYYFLDQAIVKGQVVDLSDIWEQSGLNENYPPAFRSLSEYNGKQYYLPIGYTWSAMYYNKAIFDRYDLEPPQNWTEFREVCDILLANGETPLSISGDDPWMGMLWFTYLNLRLNGAAYHQALIHGQESYNDPRVLEVLNTWQVLIDSEYFVKNPTYLSDLESLTALIRGDDGVLNQEKAVMGLATTFWVEEMPQKFQAELDFFRFPIINSEMSQDEVLWTYGYMIPNKSQHLPDTLEFLIYMSSAEAQSLLAQQTGGNTTYVPANTEVDYGSLTPEVQRGIDLVTQADAFVPSYLLSMPNPIWQMIGSGFRTFLGSRGNPEDFMAKLEEARQKGLDDGLFVVR